MATMWYYHGSQRVEIHNPSPDDICRWVEALDNHQRNYIHVNTDSSTLSVIGGHKGRVIVNFRDRSKSRRTTRLIDTLYRHRPRAVKIHMGGTLADDEPLHRTVTKARASEITSYYVKTGMLPDGLTWSRI